jgi:hypothetical protein
MSLRPIESTEPNPAKGANLNLNPDQEIEGGIWRILAASGCVEYTRFKTFTFDFTNACSKATYFFFGIAAGYFLRSIVIAIMEGVL